jgi:chemotaxis protein methyltransferase CheR
VKASPLVADPAFPALKQRVIELTGLAYYADKDRDLASRFENRLAAAGVSDCTAYLKILSDGLAGQQEMDALIGELTIGETYFFRQPEHFEALRRVVFPELIERNRASRSLRIWSAGCATGAEAYSVALLLRNDLADRIAGWDVTILGTDINREFLARAREARFDNWAFRAGPKDLKDRCFYPDGKQWVLRPEYRGLVSCQHHNLVKDPPPTACDLILCRNVMIYFNPELVRATVDRLYEALSEGGWLLVGHAELNAEVFRSFRTVNLSGVTLYQRASATAPLAVRQKETVKPAPLVAPPPAPVNRAPLKPSGLPRRRKPEDRVTEEEVRRLADRGEWQEAAVRCRKLIEMDSLNAVPHFILALVLEHAGSSAEAELSFRRAIYLDRMFVLAHYHLGLTLQRNKDSKQAKRAFENVLELLKKRPAGEPLEHGDGITVGQLKELTGMQLEMLGSA